MKVILAGFTPGDVAFLPRIAKSLHFIAAV
jgi:hypothetical protein